MGDAQLRSTVMSRMKSARIQDHFVELTDPRRREVTYPLINVVVIAVCAVICGADDFVAIAKFGRTKRDWFAKFLDLTNGIPSHDRFNAILAAIKQHPPQDRTEPIEERVHTQSGNQEQTPHRRMGRDLPRKSPTPTMTYGAIALGLQPLGRYKGRLSLPA